MAAYGLRRSSNPSGFPIRAKRSITRIFIEGVGRTPRSYGPRRSACRRGTMCLGPTRVPALSGTLVCNCGVFFDRSPFARASLSANALAGSGARTECMGRLLPGRDVAPPTVAPDCLWSAASVWVVNSAEGPPTLQVRVPEGGHRYTYTQRCKAPTVGSCALVLDA